MSILYALLILAGGQPQVGAFERPAVSCQADAAALVAQFSSRPDFVSAQVVCVPEGNRS